MKIKMAYGGDLEVGEVKPCPICGKTDYLEIQSRKSYNELVKEHGSSMLHIECKACNLELKKFDIPGNNYDMGMGMLITTWNNRKEG